MTDEPSTSTPRIFAQPAAILFASLMVAALALVSICSRLALQSRKSLEKFSEATAVGDKVYYQFSDPQNIPATIVVFQGQRLSLSALRHEHNGDSRMLRVGKDDSGVYSIYIERELADAGKKTGSEYFLKTGENEYLSLRPSS